MKKEIWKDIENYEGRYQVSNLGRVRSLSRIRGANHRLVARHFLPNPYNKKQINHIDGNGRNNVLENLEWVTPSENTLHSYRTLGNKAWHVGKKGEGMPHSKPILQKTIEGKLVKRWGCGSDAVRSGEFRSEGISKCVKGVRKKHKGYVWQYE